MQTRNNIFVFLQKNMTGCRIFWAVMYTIFFVFAWVSFYSTKICMDNVRVIGKDNTHLTMSIYVALGFVVYWLLFLVIPLAYLVQERVDRVKLVFGATITSAIFKFLVSSTFPIFSICMGEVFQDAASLWMCVALVGSLVCLLMCYGNPDDYGISYAFLGIWLGVVVHLKDPFEKCIVLIIIGVSLYISKEGAFFQERNAKEVEFPKTNASKG